MPIFAKRKTIEAELDLLLAATLVQMLKQKATTVWLALAILLFYGAGPCASGADAPNQAAAQQLQPTATLQSPSANRPPPHVDSPDGRFSVEIRANSLIIRDRGKQITERTTGGGLWDAFWSDTGQYVAINNRRGHAGDYIWIFSLPDGKCIKEADTNQLDFLSKLASEAFQRLDTGATEDRLEKESMSISAVGWGSGNELLIQLSSWYDVRGQCHHFVYDAEVRLSGSTIVFVSGEARNVGEEDCPLVFVENFVKTLAVNHLDTQLSYYADRVDYYELGQVTKEAIRNDLEHDIATWPNRTYSITSAPKITRNNDGFIAEFPMKYTLSNFKGATSGTLQMTVRLKSRWLKWQVVGIQKKVIQAAREDKTK